MIYTIKSEPNSNQVELTLALDSFSPRFRYNVGSETSSKLINTRILPEYVDIFSNSSSYPIGWHSDGGRIIAKMILPCYPNPLKVIFDIHDNLNKVLGKALDEFLTVQKIVESLKKEG